MGDAELLQAMGTDAWAWADECLQVLEAKTSLTFNSQAQKDDVRDLLLGWFANAMMAQQDSITVKQAIDIAISRVHFYEVVADQKTTPAFRELELAKTRLEEAQMWFTRALALRQGKFNPADLERDDG